MLQIQALVQITQFDAKRYNEQMMKYLDQQMRIAAKVFAEAALAKIPVRTGFAAGSLGALSELIGAKARFNPLVAAARAIIGAAKKLFKLEGNGIVEYYYPPGGGKILKTPTSGRQFATQLTDIIKREGNIILFDFEVDISYFSLQDINVGRSPTAPWGAFEAGEEAMVKYIEEVLIPNTPAFEDFIVNKELRYP